MPENTEHHIMQGFLRHLAEHGGNETLREMAAEVLHGKISVAEGLAFPVYAEALRPSMDGFAQWYSTLSDDECARQADTIATELEKLEGHLSNENPGEP